MKDEKPYIYDCRVVKDDVPGIYDGRCLMLLQFSDGIDTHIVPFESDGKSCLEKDDIIALARALQLPYVGLSLAPFWGSASHANIQAAKEYYLADIGAEARHG